MSTYLNIPLLNAIKFVPCNKNMLTYANHFDYRWFKDQRLDGELGVFYKQKWIRSTTTFIQIESSTDPSDVKIYNAQGDVVKTIGWSFLFIGIAQGYNIYKFDFDISDLAEGTYFAFFTVVVGSTSYDFISEPILSKNSFDINMLIFTYSNSFNDFDVAWTLAGGVKMNFICEGCIPASQMIPKRNATSYANQDNRVKVLSATPTRSHQLYVGGTRKDIGVAPYVLDIVNRILDCDDVSINGKGFVANVNAEWKKNDIVGYPLVTGNIEIFESDNAASLQFSDTTPLAPGIVTGYNIETGVFGAGTVVPILEVQQNG
jgi:hypothetical protein